MIKVNTRKPCSSFSLDDWLKLAKQIDNGFIGSVKSFTAKRVGGYYYLNTNKCDDVSIIKVYCKIGVLGIEKIERLGEDTDGWQEVYPNTYEKVEAFLTTKK